MRIEVSVRHEDGLRDVLIDAPAHTSLGAIRAAAGSLLPPGRSLRLAGAATTIADETPWGSAGVRRGSVVVSGAGTDERPADSAVRLDVVSGPAAGRSVALSQGELLLGRGIHCDVVLDDPDTSREHALVRLGADAITVQDLGSTNGTYLDGARLGAARTELPVGSRLRVGDNVVAVTAAAAAPAAVIDTGTGTLRVTRAPRRGTPTPQTLTSETAHPAAGGPRPIQWLAALLPAAAGGVLVWVTGSPQFLLFALLSPAMVLGGALGDRLHWRRSRRRTAADAAQTSARRARALEQALESERADRRWRSPDAATVSRIAELPEERLWERGRHDDDLLLVSLGTGRCPSSTLVERDGARRPAATLSDVPISADLTAGPLGLAGPPRAVSGSARWIVAQLAALHSPADLEMIFVLGPRERGHWHWARWLPHLRDGVLDASDLDTVCAELAGRRDRGRGPAGRWAGRWTLLVVDRGSNTRPVPGLAPLLDSGSSFGVTALVLGREPAALPTACHTVAEVAGESATRLIVRTRTEAAGREVLADRVGLGFIERLARSLAPLVDGGQTDGGALPAACTLEQLHGRADPDLVLRRWAAGGGGARARLGLGVDVRVDTDLTADGPHALIAGTTGSGKSELLQTLVLGLALDQSPAELAFLLIDYKGGAAFADCARLPHTAGMVTDLDAQLTGRVLRSVRAELRRRERLLGSAGAGNLDEYRGLDPAVSIPRLVIVVDEFAALADELPDFVNGLVAVAQRGRSLGVHLVLATQRPGGAVSAEIRANTALRIALRVTDAAESSDVIDTPDAAGIGRSTPGRAFVRAGASLQPVQTAWAGAHTAPDQGRISVCPLGDWLQPRRHAAPASGATDLQRFVDAITRAAERKGVGGGHRFWLEPLPERLERSELPVPDTPTSVVFGLADLPGEQRRDPLVLDLSLPESILIVGGPRSGRTSALISIGAAAASQLPPDRLEVYTIDPAGGCSTILSSLPHCATAVTGHEPETPLRLLTLLEHRSVTRERSAPEDGPLRLLLVDGWDGFVESVTSLEATRLADQLLRLLRAAREARLNVVVTGGRSLLSPRIAGAFTRRIALRLPDVADYASLGLTPREVPTAMPPGRAVRGEDGVVVQLAVAPSAAAPAAAPSAAVPAAAPPAAVPADDAERRGYAWAGHSVSADAIRLRPLPRHAHLDQLAPRWRRERNDSTDALVVGLAGDSATPLHLDLRRNPANLMIAGPARSGRSTALELLYVQAARAGISTLVAAGVRSPLARRAARDAAFVLGPQDDVDALLTRDRPDLLLLDDCEQWTDTAVGEVLAGWLQAPEPSFSAVVSGRPEDLISAYRGIGAQLRRAQLGVLLRPGPADGELLGVPITRRPVSDPPGRGLIVGRPSWDPRFADGDAVPIQILDPAPAPAGRPDGQGIT